MRRDSSPAADRAVRAEPDATTADHPDAPPVVRAAQPTAVTRELALGAMSAAYRSLTRAVRTRPDSDLMRPTRCAGWSVIDVLYHVLLDGQRALVALATPEEHATDTDFITYWREFAGGTHPAAAGHARAVRVAAAAFRPRTVVRMWEETSEAAIRAARACAADLVLATQRHRLALPDLLATFAVEACVHTLDATVDLPDAPPAEPAPLELVRRTLDGLLGAGAPRPAWDDREYALKGTGRLALSPADRAVLAPVAGRFPLFG